MPRVSATEFEENAFDPQGQWCLLYGPEYELKVRLRDALIERAVGAGDREYAVETIAVGRGARAGLIIAAAQMPAMLSGGRAVVAEGVENLSSAEQRELARRLEAAPGTLMILVEGPRGQRSVDRAYSSDRSGRLSRELVQAVAAAGSAVECCALTRNEAIAWVGAQARSLGSAIKPAAAALLVERMGTDLGRLAREVEKLSLLALNKDEISRRDIEEGTAPTPEDNVFAVGDAIGAGNGDQALAALRDLVQYQGVAPTTALAFIARQFRLIWQAKILLDAGWRGSGEVPTQAQALVPQDAELRQYLDGRRWLVNRLLGQARRFSWPQLAFAVRRMLAAELSLKGISEGVADHRIAVEMLVLDLCRWDRG